MSSSVQAIAPPSSAAPRRWPKALALVAVLIVATAFVLKYVFHYYLHYNEAAFTDPAAGAAQLLADAGLASAPHHLRNDRGAYRSLSVFAAVAQAVSSAPSNFRAGLRHSRDVWLRGCARPGDRNNVRQGMGIRCSDAGICVVYNNLDGLLCGATTADPDSPGVDGSQLRRHLCLCHISRLQ